MYEDEKHFSREKVCQQICCVPAHTTAEETRRGNGPIGTNSGNQLYARDQLNLVQCIYDVYMILPPKNIVLKYHRQYILTKEDV